MLQSKIFIPTLKEAPSEAQIPSHILMLRAGLIRQLGAGIFSQLPLGYRSLKKVQHIIRQEMDAIGGQEFHLPALSPIDIWEQTGRVEAMGDVMFHHIETCRKSGIRYKRSFAMNQDRNQAFCVADSSP